MGEPTIDVVDELVSLVDTNFNEGNVTGSRTIEIAKSDDLGKGRDLGVFDYIEFSHTSPSDIPYADLLRSSRDWDTAVFVELKSDDQTRRQEIFDELRRVIEANDTRPDTPGDYDKMDFGTITPLDDETFGAWVFEFPILFAAKARSTA